MSGPPILSQNSLRARIDRFLDKPPEGARKLSLIALDDGAPLGTWTAKAVGLAKEGLVEEIASSVREHAIEVGRHESRFHLQWHGTDNAVLTLRELRCRPEKPHVPMVDQVTEQQLAPTAESALMLMQRHAEMFTRSHLSNNQAMISQALEMSSQTMSLNRDLSERVATAMIEADKWREKYNDLAEVLATMEQVATEEEPPSAAQQQALAVLAQVAPAFLARFMQYLNNPPQKPPLPQS